MKTLLLLLTIGFSISLNAQTEISKETKVINKKIDQAIQQWSARIPLANFPDIGSIIQQEINTSINRKLGRIYEISLEEYMKRYTLPLLVLKMDRLPSISFIRKKE